MQHVSLSVMRLPVPHYLHQVTGRGTRCVSVTMQRVKSSPAASAAAAPPRRNGTSDRPWNGRGGASVTCSAGRAR